MNVKNRKIELDPSKKVYFISDFHLGVPTRESSAAREKKVIRWLDSVKHDAQIICFVGDVFDFWFEYKHLIPKGFVRFQGKLAELADQGIQFYFFPGNHDLWMFDYFEHEFNAIVSRKPIRFEINQKVFFVVHGDGLGPGDRSHKLLLRFFESRFVQYVFKLIPADWSFGLAHFWSRSSRISNAKFDETFLGSDEWLWAFAKQVEESQHHDYYIFGHRHLVLDLEVGTNSRYVNLGEWIRSSHYAIFDGQQLVLTKFE